MTHGGLVTLAQRYFPAPRLVETDTPELAKQRVFEMLKVENRYLDPVERWKSACRVFFALFCRLDDPQGTWAAEVLDNDLATMLAALHRAGLALEIQSPWPQLW